MSFTPMANRALSNLYLNVIQLEDGSFLEGLVGSLPLCPETQARFLSASVRSERRQGIC